MSVSGVGRAVVLYGRVGTYKTRTATMKKGVPGDEVLWRMCAESIMTHVVEPWRAVGTVDVFVHSWNLELAASMDAFWQPRVARHAAQNGSMPKCPVRLMYCERTMWALLGMKNALDLRAQWVASGTNQRVEHAAVLVMRHDVLWKSAMPALRADGNVRLWLPFDCEKGHRAPSSCRDDGARAAELYTNPLDVATSAAPIPKCVDGLRDEAWRLHAKSSVLGVHCNARDQRSRDFCANSVNIDWWWVGDAALADGFGDTFDRFSHYSRLALPGASNRCHCYMAMRERTG